jgi:hypothetical protein
MFLSYEQVKPIYFNDDRIVEKYENVKKLAGHDDHFHVQMKDN